MLSWRYIWMHDQLWSMALGVTSLLVHDRHRISMHSHRRNPIFCWACRTKQSTSHPHCDWKFDTIASVMARYVPVEGTPP
jgi:hypothetical protein